MGKIILISIVFTILLSSFFTFSNPTRGEKIGKIVKVSKEGVFNKTWEAELIRGGFSDGSGVLGSSFHFTIENPVLVEEARKCMENQTDIILHYHSEFINSCFRSEKPSPKFADKIIHRNNI